MTNEEAVKVIKAGGWGYPENMVTEANLMAVEALEKGIPKPVTQKEGSSTSLFGEALCPICGLLVFGTEKFCSECGQALEWPEVEG